MHFIELTERKTSATTGLSVLENENTKIFWDFIIHIYKIIKVRKTDIIVVDKRNSETSSGGFRVTNMN